MAASIRHVREIKKLLSKSPFLQKSISKEFEIINSCQIRCHHLLSSNIGHSKLPVIWRAKTPHICAVLIQRFNSTDNASKFADTVDYIPPPPLPAPESLDIADTLNALGEPTFASLGLNNYTPAGVVQMALEALHVDMGMPWWGAIALATVVVRLMMLPIAVISRRHIIKMNNHMPELARLQERMSECRLRGDLVGTARYGSELMEYYQKHDIKLFRNMMMPMAQLPVFLSWFTGLRGMAHLPVESLATGGLLWFKDLTVPDPIFLLPVLTMATLSITVEVGADGVAASQQKHVMKWGMRLMPVLGLLFVCNFPTAMCCYWFTSNTFSLVQVLFFKIPAVRQFLKIPEMVIHPQPKKKKPSFSQGFKDSWESNKIVKQIEDRQRADALRFKEAGKGPIQKTYTYDPTKLQKPGEDYTYNKRVGKGHAFNQSKIDNIVEGIKMKAKS